MAEQGSDADWNEGEVEKDTDEEFEDQPEEAEDESRISVEKVNKISDESFNRSADTNEIVEETGGTPPAELRFDHNDDFSGNEANESTTADFSRGSGFVGGKLIGEPSTSAEEIEEPSSQKGFDSSFEQQKNIQAALREASTSVPEASSQPETESWKAGGRHPEMGGDLRNQGRDIGRREQATGLQRFGRDVGASGLPNSDDRFEATDPIQAEAANKEHAVWNRVLSRLGGSSPGSDENLLLAEKFGRVQFPSTPEEVTQRLDPGAEFRVKEGIAINLRQAVSESRLSEFRNMNDLIDCVKDALRRAESLERHPA